MMHFYILIKEKSKICFESYEKLVKSIYSFLIELDKFKNDNYHKIFYYTFMLKKKKNQSYIAMKLHMDQSTISRKLKEIQDYFLIKIKEQKNK